MATGDYEAHSDDSDDNAEASAETTKQIGDGTNALPWVLAKARLKVAGGKKHANKSHKRGAGGAKAKKKGASKTGSDNKHETSEADRILGLRADSPKRDPASSSVSSTGAADEQTGDLQHKDALKADEELQQALDTAYVTWLNSSSLQYKMLSLFTTMKQIFM